MKEFLTTFCAIFSGVLFAAPYVTNVVAKQRSPWGIVDISCDVAGIEEETKGLDFIVEAVLPDSGEAKKAASVRFRGNGNSSDLSNLLVVTNGNYQFVWNATADLGTARYTNVLMRVSIRQPAAVQLWKDGPYWATRNIGAKNPWEFGYYFWWGDTIGYRRENDKWVASDGSNANFVFSESNTPTYDDSSSDKFTPILQSEGWITTDGVLASEHDAAHAHWGGNWRMPTEDELRALNSNCYWTWTTQNGVNGYIVEGRGAYASNSIFLPATGCGDGTSLNYSGSFAYYWSSVLHQESNSHYAYAFGLDERLHNIYQLNRYRGQPVRPVLGFTK